MASKDTLHLYEEVMLLALRDKEGTVANSHTDYALAAAVLAELLLDGYVAIEPGRKKLLDLRNSAPTGDVVIDECLDKIRSSNRRATMTTWVSRLVSIRRLRHKAAQQLCRRGILRADERRILLIFTQKIYPEINPAPEKKIIERMRAAIFSDAGTVDARTAVLVSLASATQLLNFLFGRKQIKQRKKRLKEITSGSAAAQAAREVIESVQLTIMAAAATAAIAASAS